MVELYLDICNKSTRKVNYHQLTKAIQRNQGYTSDHQNVSAERQSISTTMSTYVEPHSISRNAASTPNYEVNTTAINNTFIFENSVFSIQIGIVYMFSSQICE